MRSARAPGRRGGIEGTSAGSRRLARARRPDDHRLLLGATGEGRARITLCNIRRPPSAGSSPERDRAHARARNRRVQRDRLALRLPSESLRTRPRGRLPSSHLGLRLLVLDAIATGERAGAHSRQMAAEPRRCLRGERDRRLHARAVRRGAHVPRPRLLAVAPFGKWVAIAADRMCSSASARTRRGPPDHRGLRLRPRVDPRGDNSVFPGWSCTQRRLCRARRRCRSSSLDSDQVRRVALVALVFLVFAPVARAGCGDRPRRPRRVGAAHRDVHRHLRVGGLHLGLRRRESAAGRTVTHVFPAGYWRPALTSDAGAEPAQTVTSISLSLSAPRRARYAQRVERARRSRRGCPSR